MDVKSVNYKVTPSFKAKMFTPDDVSNNMRGIIDRCNPAFSRLTKNYDFDFGLFEIASNGDIYTYIAGKLVDAKAPDGSILTALVADFHNTFAKPVNIYSDTFLADILKRFKEVISLDEAMKSVKFKKRQ